MRAYITSGSPSVHKGPEPQYAAETWQDWLRRQNNPTKKNGPVAPGPFEAPKKGH